MPEKYNIGDSYIPKKKFTKGIWIPGWLLELDNKIISSNSKLIYGYLAFKAGDNGECFPSQKNIAECLGMSKRTVQREIALLSENEIISKKQRGVGRSNNYEFIVNKWNIKFLN
jgi:hypothetical protein